MSVSAGDARAVLSNLGCEVVAKGKEWVVIPPPYRLDLSIKEDLAEEIARSLGYDKIASTIPKLSSAPHSLFKAEAAAKLALLERAKDSLKESGLNESLNFSFTSKAWLSKLGMSSDAKLVNPLSAEHEVLVPSLLPGLIQNALSNWNHHFGSEPLAIRLFELRPTFHPMGPVAAKGEMETGMSERVRLAFAIAGPRYAQAL
jgi:phenylalanyl-tRNA synthetase beta chain